MKVNEYYDKQADEHKASSDSTMTDQYIREQETRMIKAFISLHPSKKEILDVGCGNGYTTDFLTRLYPDNRYTGIDLNDKLLNIARDRGNTCDYQKKDVSFICDDSRCLIWDNRFDLVISQRCIINLSSWTRQKKALDEIYRVLAPGGCCLLIECFTDGLENNNRARVECGLPALKQASVNQYLRKEDVILDVLEDHQGDFEMVDPFIYNSGLPHYNFLSTHYFVARVLHALVTRGGQVKNTAFVGFFDSCLPVSGCFSPLQAFVLKKKGG